MIVIYKLEYSFDFFFSNSRGTSKVLKQLDKFIESYNFLIRICELLIEL